ncbi:MAG: Holliday junction resolvase RuvX [Candidatus Margulisbacteria bacterium]|nr:Holliday junction resolvase RuvX [Candidatus Margulisiibacteriota bacterium]
MNRIMAIDLGTKRIGIAVSDLLGLTAQPATVLEKKADGSELDDLAKLIDEYGNVSELLVGLPKTLKGEEGPAAQNARSFAEQLKERFKLKVTLWDERLTTAAATKFLISAGVSRADRKKVIDKSAAAGILQNYLDRLGKRERT